VLERWQSTQQSSQGKESQSTGQDGIERHGRRRRRRRRRYGRRYGRHPTAGPRRQPDDADAAQPGISQPVPVLGSEGKLNYLALIQFGREESGAFQWRLLIASDDKQGRLSDGTVLSHKSNYSILRSLFGAKLSLGVSSNRIWLKRPLALNKRGAAG